jgi:serine acetyltransferase
MNALAARLRRAAQWWKLRRCEEVGRGVRALGRIWIHGGGAIRLADGVLLDGRVVPIELHAARGAEILLGPGVRVDGGASLEAECSIVIGARVHVGRWCKILDNHFHRVGARDERPESVPVIVEDDADLGPRAILLPGAHVGRAACIGPGAVLTRAVPEGSVVAGLPALVRRR